MDMIISPEQFELAQRLAIETLSRFSTLKGHYNNTSNSHLRGKIGEIAASSALEELGMKLENTYTNLDRMSEADIVIPGKLRIDVKTWNIEHWAEMGRCIAIDQLGKLEKKADIIIWCTSPNILTPGINVEVVGWNKVSEVGKSPRRMTGPKNGRKVDNFQLDIKEIRDLSDLEKLL
jgi:hypothetical protein